MKNSDSACKCPYCDAPVSDDSFTCQPCRVKLVRCSTCGKPRAESSRRCPHCGDEKPATRVRRT
jgi:hypothetical protein